MSTEYNLLTIKMSSISYDGKHISIALSTLYAS